ncbi:MAG: alpha/beta hydrolase [Clostridia bacterium]|nr:alpha/beta hydrolase [Clostridia bacterium]
MLYNLYEQVHKKEYSVKNKDKNLKNQSNNPAKPQSDKKRIIKGILIALSAIVLVIAIFFGALAIYAADYYRADMQAISAMSEGREVKRTELDGGHIAYGDGDEPVGFIFYPGGKVEHTAYEPLMKLLASKGIFCVLVKMPFNLAVLDINAADRISEQYSDINSWYIGGHSLGGSMAAACAQAKPQNYRGLILLGSYSTSDLAETDLAVLCLHGTEDEVMNDEKHDECKNNLPSGTICSDIEGGCHAYFGVYGEQSGDGEPTISPEQQIAITADSIHELIIAGE